MTQHYPAQNQPAPAPPASSSLAPNHLAPTYGKLDIVFEKGQGSWLFDSEGNRYLDFLCGIAVNVLGHAHPALADTMSKQAEKLVNCSNYFYTREALELSEALCRLTGLSSVFFCNSGTESNEAAIKFARKYGGKKAKPGSRKDRILYMKNSFHGRTTGALAVTGQPKYQDAFRPLMEAVDEVTFNDLSSVKARMDHTVCAVITEPIQGESGVIPADPDFLPGLRQLCDQHDALLITDEVQSGMGRTGKLFAYQHWDLLPDVVTVAKGLAGGVPIGAAILSKKVTEIIEPGDHGSTFGSNPFSCACALTVLRQLTEEGLIEQAPGKSKLLLDQLEDLKKRHPIIRDIRGKGLFIGLELAEKATQFRLECLRQGLLLAGSGGETVRILPPLTVSDEEILTAVNLMEKALVSL